MNKFASAAALLTIAAATAISSSAWAETFQLNYHGKNPRDISVMVTGDHNGFIRGRSSHRVGEPNATDDGIKCGETKWFEVWSNRNFSIYPPLPPGLTASRQTTGDPGNGAVLIRFSVGNDSINPVRSFDSTYKKESHWKDQDFGVHLNCVS